MGTCVSLIAISAPRNAFDGSTDDTIWCHRRNARFVNRSHPLAERRGSTPGLDRPLADHNPLTHEGGHPAGRAHESHDEAKSPGAR